MSTIPTPRTDAQADIEITVTINSGKKETWSLDAVSKRFAREMETELRADLARVTAERDELKKSRDAAAWANQQLTLVLINAGAPEFSSAAHALEWATETATLCARVAELEELANSWCDRAQQLQQRNAELVASLAELFNTTARIRFDIMGRLAWRLVAETSAWKLNTVAMVGAEKLMKARAESATPAKAQCQFCGSELLWSEDRGAHCDGCGAEPDLDTPAPRADTVRLDWLFANTIIAAPDGHVIDCREDLDAAMKGGAHD